MDDGAEFLPQAAVADVRKEVCLTLNQICMTTLDV